jgi:hypothetical protein
MDLIKLRLPENDDTSVRPGVGLRFDYSFMKDKQHHDESSILAGSAVHVKVQKTMVECQDEMRSFSVHRSCALIKSRYDTRKNQLHKSVEPPRVDADTLASPGLECRAFGRSNGSQA